MNKHCWRADVLIHLKSHVPLGRITPWWLHAVYAVLFPIHALRDRLCRNCGYDLETDAWNLDGVKVSGEALRDIEISKKPQRYIIEADEHETRIKAMPIPDQATIGDHNATDPE